MAVTNAMFIFEVVVEHVKSFVESKMMVIRGEFADIFSLELKDPKTMYIVIPDQPPLPPEPPGKKGKKKKKKPKPKKKKGKKGKKGLPPPPPPEPAIQAGQSVLFTSSAEFLIKLMLKFPLQVTLWSKEDAFVYIGTSLITWDPMFLTYLEEIMKCKTPPPVTVKDEYNVFEENTAKLMAKVGIQIKLSHLGEKVTAAFRTLSEDPAVKKCLYTGMNSKTTSYLCTQKTTDDMFEQNSNKIENSFIKDKPIIYANYKNVPGANLMEFHEGDYCCINKSDKPPDSKYTAPIKVPTIDFIIDYVRTIIASCNDNMRMITPRPTLTPRARGTDIDRLCYCKQSQWPESALAQKFKKEVQSGPCAICAEAGKMRGEVGRGPTFDIANIRGPCGKPDCKIARQIKLYIESLIDEDNIEICLDDIVGPCGSKLCTLAEKIQEFLRREGVFTEGELMEGLTTQCACIQKMQEALAERTSCHSICSDDCEEADDDPDDTCGGKGCPFMPPSQPLVYNVYYFTVEHNAPSPSGSTSGKSSPPPEKDPKEKYSGTTSGKSSPLTPQTDPKYKDCAEDCPSMRAAEVTVCTKDVCQAAPAPVVDEPCPDAEHPCPIRGQYPASPADSHVEIELDKIHNPCCSITCDVADTVKKFIVDGLAKKKDVDEGSDACYCDCVCDFNFTKNTTYCAVCGGYECLGVDMENQPDYIKPLPCPIFHKLYDKKYIETEDPFPEDNKTQNDNISVKTTKTTRVTSAGAKKESSNLDDSETENVHKTRAGKSAGKKKTRSSTSVSKVRKTAEVKKPSKYPYPHVPANMGWNWLAEDIPGLKPRPYWRPGAISKALMRRYRALREGGDIIKKKRGLVQKKKKADCKPLLKVTKKDGEYSVQMEVFKKYSKERLLHQYPYEDKPPLIYTIGKTEEEKRKIQKQRERRERRETRRKSRLLQSTFRDKCQEICVKAYNQAIGLLPPPNPNDPRCPCYTKPTEAFSPPIDSCSCSEEGSISSSETDGDEWVVEFSPPAALYDTKAMHPPVTADNDSQYNYMDYKVKLLDKQGQQVPRYFKGPDGKIECSDLGGFWGPDKVWLEINKDGYIGPDGRWIPHNFFGPDGLPYTSEEGRFTDKEGNHLKIGIDGYINKDGKWEWYPRSRPKQDTSKTRVAACKDKRLKRIATRCARGGKKLSPTSSPTKTPSKKDLKKTTSTKHSPSKKDLKKIASPKDSSKRHKNRVVMSMSANFAKPSNRRFRRDRIRLAPQPVPLSPAELRKRARYRQIMTTLSAYADIGLINKNPPRTIQTNRACNTPKKLSPYPSYFECNDNGQNIQKYCADYAKSFH